MSDRFEPLPAGTVAAWVSAELETAGSVFGIPRGLWFRPRSTDRFTLDLHGDRLDTPIGVAAGPHTQLTQNIVVAWLCGARTIELKTVQTLDRIEVAKPCIDMPDEGYNIEWSQELTVNQSTEQYLTAWLLVHALHRRLGFPGERPGVAFDVSVGYDLEGLGQPNMRRFLASMTGAGDELHRLRDEVAPWFPEVRDLDLDGSPAAGVTLSTLHGCPPDEIGAMAEHLMDAWTLDTAVKLNPTLLGSETVRRILVRDLGWTQIELHLPSFDADIGYDDAVDLVNRLSDHARDRGVGFGLKLCNTLPVVNRRPNLGGTDSTAYLSGRPLHALVVELARRLTDDAPGGLAISFAGGADAFNTPALLSAGLRPVTVCSDLLRPGGYLRLRQYLEEIDAALDRKGALDLDDLAVRWADNGSEPASAARLNLARYARELRGDPEVIRASYRRDHTKTRRTLGPFDCIEAPCTDACSVDQQVPAYMRHVASGEIESAAAVIGVDNALPSILGRACHHPCEPVCVRTHLDEPLAIREIKRFVTDHARHTTEPPRQASSVSPIAIVGGGPCGLAAAVELARAGIRVVVFEARPEGGGMVSATIPGYRASPRAVERDLDAIIALGVEFEFGTRVGRDVSLRQLRERGFDHVIVAVGAQLGAPLAIEGEDAAGVLDGLDFLRAARAGFAEGLGRKIAVVGGGDVAVDCARTARRLSDGRVEVLYRRTVNELPAHPDEIRELTAEGISIRELAAPRRIVARRGRIESIECSTMALGEPDGSGRPRPYPVPGATFTVELDTLIVAIGQRVDLGVFGGSVPRTTAAGFVEVDPATMETSIPRVYAGGDLRAPGPSSIVDACGDGRRIARAILTREQLRRPQRSAPLPPAVDPVDLLRRRSHRLPRVEIPRTASRGPDGFDETTMTLSAEAAIAEASRCLDCDVLCATCEGVCPNRAIVSYRLPRWRVVLPRITVGPQRAATAMPSERIFEIVQEPQIAVVTDLCNECGNCATFCPTAGHPWRDKPRLYLHRPSFESEDDNAFMLLSIGGAPAIQGMFGGALHQLTVRHELDYRTPTLTATLDRDSLDVLEIRRVAFDPADDTPPLESCAVLWALLSGLSGSMPHLPVPEADPNWLVDPS